MHSYNIFNFYPSISYPFGHNVEDANHPNKTSSLEMMEHITKSLDKIDFFDDYIFGNRDLNLYDEVPL